MANRNRGLQRQGSQQQQQQSRQITLARSGPLPDPSELERYDLIVPGMAERLLINFEQQSEHRMAMERQVITADIRRSNLGLYVGSAFAVLVLVAAVALILLGHESAGVAAIIVEFVTLAGTFAYGNISRRRERDRKAGGE